MYNSQFFYYTLTFIITVLKVKTSEYSWIQAGGLLWDWVKKEERFQFLGFAFRVSV